jgi:hypothetical protein
VHKRESEVDSRHREIQRLESELEAVGRRAQQREAKIEEQLSQIKREREEVQELKQRIRQREAELQLQLRECVQRVDETNLLRDEVELLRSQAALDAREKALYQRKLQQVGRELQLVADKSQLRESSVAASASSGQKEGLCVICMESPAEFAVIPCGHKCVCKGDAELISKRNECPVCRASVHGCFYIWHAGI